MPQSFESFGIKFLYPDNWKQMERPDDEGKEGVTLELPSGGFFTVEKFSVADQVDDLIKAIKESFDEDYGDVELERIAVDELPEVEDAFEFRFYYLDLLVISRLLILEREGSRLAIQMQAESRDFDENERVFAALIQQIRS